MATLVDIGLLDLDAPTSTLSTLSSANSHISTQVVWWAIWNREGPAWRGNTTDSVAEASDVGTSTERLGSQV